MNRSFIICIFLSFLFTSCLRSLEKEGITNTTVYKGRVIDNSNKPLSGIMVRITNGRLIHNSSSTNIEGIFEVLVDATKIDAEYYIQIGEEGSFVKRSSLKGFGLDIYDYGDIPFVDIKLPTVETLDITNMTQKSFTIKCNVKSKGEAIVTERGLCWATSIPTIEDNKVPSGSGEGEYSCTVADESIDYATTTYYARAYAKNEYGVGYGEPVELNSSKLKGFSLPTMNYAGYTYTIHPDLGGMTWSQANEACENLVADGYDDWYLPNKEEALAVAEKTNVLDSKEEYWTSTQKGGDWGGDYYYLDYSSGWYASSSYSDGSRIRRTIPVRKSK